MTTKGTIAALIAIIIIGSVVLYTLAKNDTEVTPTGTTSEAQNASPMSNDQIIDNLVDGLAEEETAAASATIDATTPPSNESAATNINTNF